ncbi:hypothetical protein PR202_gb00767 [Eleusine coracana subsp. coracana]|uniref:Uncharacterized protein n=1 Tax=Eleusine coracana subsp. coracana TaxID=191504 RepID=A0AAV5DU68_ELECO|nr:hypothetical protein PR202_gb00767 [Eleusine coracana subsp. coracana]
MQTQTKTQQQQPAAAAAIMSSSRQRRPDQEAAAKATEDMSHQFFDAGKPPPFRIGDIRAAIPETAGARAPGGRSRTWRATSSWWRRWPSRRRRWIDGRCGRSTGPRRGPCSGHSSSSDTTGTFTFSLLLCRHITEKVYRQLEQRTKKLRFTPPFPLLAFPVYLLYRSPGKSGSHFLPSSDLFSPKEHGDVMVSTTCWSIMFASLIGMACVFGPLQVLKIYGIPYLVFVMWLDLVTYLHHHGHQDLPWYRGEEWSYLRGGLTTIDRDYGWINKIHHDIGTHVIHHLFPQIPHYHLVEATKAARPVLGRYYREPEKSGPLPLHLFGVLLRSLRMDHFVSDHGDVVYYQTDDTLNVAGNWAEADKLK